MSTRRRYFLNIRPPQPLRFAQTPTSHGMLLSYTYLSLRSLAALLHRCALLECIQLGSGSVSGSHTSSLMASAVATMFRSFLSQLYQTQFNTSFVHQVSLKFLQPLALHYAHKHMVEQRHARIPSTNICPIIDRIDPLGETQKIAQITPSHLSPGEITANGHRYFECTRGFPCTRYAANSSSLRLYIPLATNTYF